MQIEGYILIQALAGNEASELADRLARIPGVTKAEPVNGPYDVIAEVRMNGDAGNLPAERAIRELAGVLRAIPLFRSGTGASLTSDGEAAA